MFFPKTKKLAITMVTIKQFKGELGSVEYFGLSSKLLYRPILISLKSVVHY